MIKVIAFDFVGVLVSENDIFLTDEEDRLERLFGENISDESYLNDAKNIIPDDSLILKTTPNIINKLYEVKDKDLFKKIKEKYPDIKIVIATNHVSYVKDYITNNFDEKYLDDIIISAEIHAVKPNKDFFEYILNKYNLKPEELLFLDDSARNILGANKLNINTIKVDKDTNLYDAVCMVLDGDNNEYTYNILDEVYQWMLSKQKNVEVRILKEKSSMIQIGDYITFNNQDNENEFIKVKVVDKDFFNNVDELLKKYDVNNIMPNHTCDELKDLLSKIYGDDLNKKPIVAFKLEYIASDKD